MAQQGEAGRSRRGGRCTRWKVCRLDVAPGEFGQNPCEGWNDRDPPPKAFPTHLQARESCYNHPHPQTQSSVILWFHHSIFKPVEWECFWVPCSHRWWWEESQEYVACSKCPLHYVITPFPFHRNQDYVISESQEHRCFIHGSMAAAHTYVRNTKGGISPSYTHPAMNIARIQHIEQGHFSPLAPQTGGRGHTRRGEKNELNER